MAMSYQSEIIKERNGKFLKKLVKKISKFQEHTDTHTHNVLKEMQNNKSTPWCVIMKFLNLIKRKPYKETREESHILAK